MRDALGGTVVIAIIVVFTVIMLSYLAFNVNYTKAFKMKDKIITYYNEYDGKCETACHTKIEKYADSIGYNVPQGTWSCPALPGASKTEKIQGLYCAYLFDVPPKAGSIDDTPKYYYKVMTKIYIDVPIISNIFHFDTFTIDGNTKLYEVK